MLTTLAGEAGAQPQAKCDFCDLHLKTDLDISRHLSSDSHRSKLAQFLSLQNLNTRSVQKDVPKNLVQVLQTLKLRNEHDAKELAEKTFFKIYDDTIAEIAMELNKSLFRTLVEFETRSLAPGVRTAFINALDTSETSTNDNNLRQQPPKAKPKPDLEKATTSKSSTDEATRQSTKTSTNMPQTSPAQKSDSIRPNPSPKDNLKPHKPATPPVKKTPTTSSQSPANQPAKKPGQIPRIQRQEQPTGKPQQQNLSQSTSSNKSQPRPAQQSKPQQPTKAPLPKPPQKQATAPPQPAPISKPLTTEEGYPIRADSTYKPKIAVVPKIKVEPKDD